MEQNEKIAMYDRLYAIGVKFEADPVPNPAYLFGAIIKCHQYIEETERYHIQVTREMSVVQRARNDVQAEYQDKKDKILDEMFEKKDRDFLPNIKDREARANQRLKEEINRIQAYDNELNDLNSLLRITTLKMRNLNQTNQDIRSQIKLLESQLKLNALPKTNPVMQSFVEELNKSTIGEDSFKDSSTTTVEEDIVDPSADLDVDSLLNPPPSPDLNTLPKQTPEEHPEVLSKVPDEQVMIDAGLMEPVPDLNPEADGISGDSIDEEQTTLDEPWESTTAEEETSVSPSPVVYLDVIIGKLEPGGVAAAIPTVQIPNTKSEIKPDVTSMIDMIGEPLPSPVVPVTAPQGETKKSIAGIDLDDLLDSINKNGK